MEEGGWIVREYMNMLDVAAIFSVFLSPQAMNPIVRRHQPWVYSARGCLLTVEEKNADGFEARSSEAEFSRTKGLHPS